MTSCKGDNTRTFPREIKIDENGDILEQISSQLDEIGEEIREEMSPWMVSGDYYIRLGEWLLAEKVVETQRELRWLEKLRKTDPDMYLIEMGYDAERDEDALPKIPSKKSVTQKSEKLTDDQEYCLAILRKLGYEGEGTTYIKPIQVTDAEKKKKTKAAARAQKYRNKKATKKTEKLAIEMMESTGIEDPDVAFRGAAHALGYRVASEPDDILDRESQEGKKDGQHA